LSLPLQTLTFYRLADVTLGAATIVGLLDALWAALPAATDFHGTTLPATHVWPWSRYQNAGTTEALYTTGVPTSSGLTQSPRFLLAGRVTIGTPTMLTDTATASNLMIGQNLRGGAFATWDSAAPFTSGVFSGLYRATAVGANAVTTVVRCFVSQETIFIQVLQSSTSQYWLWFGAIVEPWTNDTTNDSETDNRVYGMVVSGGAGINTFNLQQSGSQCFFTHGTSNGNAHATVFIPNTLTSGSGGQYAAESCFSSVAVATTTQFLTTSSAVLNVPIFAGRDGAGNALGRFREAYFLGSKQGGLTYQVGGADKVHILATNNGAAADAMTLRAA